jgi:hypothetical protein
MIETHIKDNPKFHKLSPQKTISSLRKNLKLIISLEDNLIYHCFQMISNFIWFLGMLNQAILFICEILQENWVIHSWNSILACTHYMDAKYRLYVFFLFSVLHLCLRISLSRIPMYMFFGNIFKIIKLDIFKNNLCWCHLYQNGYVGIWSILSILLV